MFLYPTFIVFIKHFIYNQKKSHNVKCLQGKKDAKKYKRKQVVSEAPSGANKWNLRIQLKGK